MLRLLVLVVFCLTQLSGQVNAQGMVQHELTNNWTQAEINDTNMTGILCNMLCPQVINAAKTVIVDGQAFLLQVVDKHLCPLFKLHQAECTMFASETKTVLEMIESAFTPSEVCSLICPFIPFAEAAYQESSKADPDQFCLVCHLATKLLKSKLKNNATVNELETMMDNMCSLLTDTLRDQCKGLVTTIINDVINTMNNKEKFSQICVQVGLCKPKLQFIKKYEQERVLVSRV
jgi:hypothetical protein